MHRLVLVPSTRRTTTFWTCAIPDRSVIIRVVVRDALVEKTLAASYPLHFSMSVASHRKMRHYTCTGQLGGFLLVARFFGARCIVIRVLLYG